MPLLARSIITSIRPSTRPLSIRSCSSFSNNQMDMLFQSPPESTSS
nr:hypothetical protein Q903MT_gene140 [Picea sitchensis]